MTGSGVLDRDLLDSKLKRVISVGLKSPEPYWTCSYYDRLRRTWLCYELVALSKPQTFGGMQIVSSFTWPSSL